MSSRELWSGVAGPRRRRRRLDSVETEHFGSGGRSAWSEGGTRREPQQLKHRAVDEVRIVLSPPQPTALLHAYLSEHGTAPDGRLFRGTPAARSPRASTATPGVGPVSPHSLPRRSPHRSAVGPTTSGTLRCRPGSTGAYRRRKWRSGPGTASTYCCGSTPSASPVRRTPCAGAWRKPAAGTFMIASVMRPWIPVDGGHQPDTPGQHEIGPGPCSC